MNYIFQSIKGMHDYLPKENILWNQIEKKFKKLLYNYGYYEIKLPILEKTILFQESIGKMTDIIGKEMYSFYDKNNNSITLRPEATTSCARAVIQNKLLYHQKQKLWYHGPMFRYERPQKGRYRQFYQFGIETFGFSELDIELELIMIIYKLFKKLGILKFLTLEINSIGSISERKKYQIKLRDFLQKYISVLDNHCIYQLNNNPLRILDSKNKHIQEILLKSPPLINFINKKSKIRFEKLCSLIDNFKIPYKINYNLIRGLDYYNDTVFEWKTNYIGSQNAICAGGRYDTLVQTLLGPKTPAIGLAIGMDRLLLLMKSCQIMTINTIKNDIHIFFGSSSIQNQVRNLSEYIRNKFPTLKILLEFQCLHIKKILNNIKKYSSKIIIFFHSNNLINIFDVKHHVHKIIHQNDIIMMIHNILKMYNK